MKKIMMVAVFAIAMLAGCSAKEFNAGADSMTSDITNAFEGSKDSSK